MAHLLLRAPAASVGHFLIALRLLVMLAVVGGCQVQLVSQYDEATYTQAKNLQAKIDRQFQAWTRMPAGSKGLAYSEKANLDFYADVSADLSVLGSLVKAHPMNQVTSGMVATVADSLETVEKFHKDNGTIGPAALGSAQKNIDFQLQRLMAFELAKKRGETPKG